MCLSASKPNFYKLKTTPFCILNNDNSIIKIEKQLNPKSKEQFYMNNSRNLFILNTFQVKENSKDKKSHRESRKMAR